MFNYCFFYYNKVFDTNQSYHLEPLSLVVKSTTYTSITFDMKQIRLEQDRQNAFFEIWIAKVTANITGNDTRSSLGYEEVDVNPTNLHTNR
jgi:hypothetical protein